MPSRAQLRNPLLHFAIIIQPIVSSVADTVLVDTDPTSSHFTSSQEWSDDPAVALIQAECDGLSIFLSLLVICGKSMRTRPREHRLDRDHENILAHATSVLDILTILMNNKHAINIERDELPLHRDAQNGRPCGLQWREEDIDALVRDETGTVWRWSLRNYEQ